MASKLRRATTLMAFLAFCLHCVTPAVPAAEDIREDPAGLNPPSKKRIIFVCGGDAGMARKQKSLREQIKLAVSKMKAPMAINICFMQGATPVMLSKDGPLPATEENRMRAAAFVDNIKLVPTTKTAPSMTAALSQKPDLIYLLTNDIKDSADLLKAIKAQNKPDANGIRPVKINTIAFVDDKDTGVAEVQKLLRSIAEENGGMFMLVSDEKLKD